MITLKGKLIFDQEPLTEKHIEQSSWKKHVNILFYGELDLFYSNFINKNYFLNLIRPQRGPHASIISDEYRDEKTWERVKKKWNGKKVVFNYDPDVRGNHEYWWMFGECETADKIRKELGLKDPFYKYHITIGAVKEKEKEMNASVLKFLHYNKDKRIK